MNAGLIHKIGQFIKKENGDSFTVLMTALSVILLAFFVLLNSLAEVDKEKMDKAVKSIQGNFGALPASWGALMGIGPVISPDFEVLAIPEIELHMLSRELEDFIMKENVGGDIGFFSSSKGTIISFSEKVGFYFGSAELEPPMFPILDKIAEIIEKSSSFVHVEGHTDKSPAKSKKYRSNWELSTARAVNILRYLVEKRNVDPKKIAASGFGSTKPLFANDTPLNKKRNRRVEIMVLKNKRDL